jgi:hypothetical protein
MQDEVRSQAKQRLYDLLKAAVGGMVVATATLLTPSAEASTPKTALVDRINELRKQNLVSNIPAPIAPSLLDFHNWGNHWHNWDNWHNWHNWHNHY